MQTSRKRLRDTIRAAVLLHVSLLSPALVSCGGQTTPNQGSKSDASAADGSMSEADGAGICNDAIDAGPPCTIIPCVPPMLASGGTCITFNYAIFGTAESCWGPADAAASTLSAATCASLCPPPPSDAGIAPNSTPFGCYAYGRQLECEWNFCGTGRTTRGLRSPRVRRPDDAEGALLARAAYLEAASVLAFERLARELAHHGAPERLLRALHRAARDEERHADSMGALARKAGASTQRPRLRRTRPRSLEAIALENAVEGCVRETFGAAIVLAQAFTAADPDVRSAMRKIAPDELRHAELARRVARWIEPRLQPAARERVARARARATRDLVDAVAVPVATGLSLRFGNAGSEVATGIARRLGPLLRA